MSKEELDGWKEAVVSVILDPNNNCRQGAFGSISSSVNGFANLEITIIEPRQRVGVKAIEIKILPTTGKNKFQLLTDWVNENIVDKSINKKVLLGPWEMLLLKEEQGNQKAVDSKKILAKMMLDSLRQIKDRNGILNTVINKEKARFSDIKKAETINKTIEGTSDGESGENYKTVGGQRIGNTLVFLHESTTGRSFTFERLKIFKAA